MYENCNRALFYNESTVTNFDDQQLHRDFKDKKLHLLYAMKYQKKNDI